MSVVEPVGFYNIGPGRPDRQVHAELLALTHDQPRYVGLVEATGYPDAVFDVRGYRAIRGTGESGRGLVLLVRDDVRVRGIRWHGMKRRWPRLRRAGTGPARVFLTLLDVDLDLQVVLGHAPPIAAGKVAGGVAAQDELVDALAGRMRPHPAAARARRLAGKSPRRRMLLWDANRRRGEDGPGPTALAERIGGQVIGDGVDSALLVNAEAASVRYVKVAGPTSRRVRLLTDHTRGALKFLLHLPERATRPARRRRSRKARR